MWSFLTSLTSIIAWHPFFQDSNYRCGSICIPCWGV